MTSESNGVRRALLAHAVRIHEELGGMPVNLDKLCDKLNIKVRRRTLKGAEGLLFPRGQGWSVVLPERPTELAFKDFGRDRFTLAHEIGHVLLKQYGKTYCLSAKQCESLCDEFASELLLPSGRVREWWFNSELESLQGRTMTARVRQLARISGTSIQAAGRAVSKSVPSVLVVGFHYGLGKPGTHQSDSLALRVKWSSSSEDYPHGIFRYKRIPSDHLLFDIYRSGGCFVGRTFLELPSLEPSEYEVTFSPYDGVQSEFYLMVINAANRVDERSGQVDQRAGRVGEPVQLRLY